MPDATGANQHTVGVVDAHTAAHQLLRFELRGQSRHAARRVREVHCPAARQMLQANRV
jgi:nitric oxide synthase oxygenase domain/subunit